jgi:hypothetical protein
VVRGRQELALIDTPLESCCPARVANRYKLPTRRLTDKTSSVHFVRFELSAAMVAALKAGAPLAIGVDHPGYRARLEPVPKATRQALLADLA